VTLRYTNQQQVFTYYFNTANVLLSYLNWTESG